ncbi:integrase core domain-containing protein [Desulfitobacterium sp. Sab5]|uniref:integrase core domain-containing protein n=1 Tax=Desulfitobacterium nosdiversum TaxID=3375356 RepID=UPI003CEEFF9E
MSGKLSRTVLRRGKGSNPFSLVDYTSREYRQELDKYHIRQSMGRTGSCFDNARMESFFATLKKDLIYRIPLYKLTREEVRSKVFAWIELYYNLERRYTANEGNLPPLKKRALFLSKVA